MAAMPFSHPVVKFVVEHGAEFFPCHVGVGVHHLEAADVPHKLFNPPVVEYYKYNLLISNNFNSGQACHKY